MESEEECEFVADSADESNKESVIQRVKEFSYYLTESIEKNYNFCLSVLEDKVATKKSNSDAVTAISTIATPIPYIGRGISSALKEGEIFVLNKVDKKNAKIMADLVYFFNDHKEGMRLMLIESSVAIFYSFEQQFSKLTCEGGPRRAMQKLAKDAANRIFTYFLENKQKGNVTKDDFSKAVVFGDSLKNKLGLKSGKTVTTEEEKSWKTSRIYQKVGLFCEETNLCFENEETNSSKYGHRRIFAWEDIEEIRKNWILGDGSQPSFTLKKEDLQGLISQIREYIMTKTVQEEATLDREKKQEELMDDYSSKHEEVMNTLLENFGNVLDDLKRNYEEIKNNAPKNEEILNVMEGQATIDEGRHREISEKLSEIHVDVIETKEGQAHLQAETECIHGEIVEIKTKQEEFATTATEVKETVQQLADQPNPSLSDLVKDNYEVKKVTKVVQKAGDDVSRETKKGWKKVFR